MSNNKMSRDFSPVIILLLALGLAGAVVFQVVQNQQPQTVAATSGDGKVGVGAATLFPPPLATAPAPTVKANEQQPGLRLIPIPVVPSGVVTDFKFLWNGKEETAQGGINNAAWTAGNKGKILLTVQSQLLAYPAMCTNTVKLFTQASFVHHGSTTTKYDRKNLNNFQSGDGDNRKCHLTYRLVVELPATTTLVTFYPDKNYPDVSFNLKVDKDGAIIETRPTSAAASW